MGEKKYDSQQFSSNAKQPATGASPHVNLDNVSTVFQFGGSGGGLFHQMCPCYGGDSSFLVSKQPV